MPAPRPGAAGAAGPEAPGVYRKRAIAVSPAGHGGAGGAGVCEAPGTAVTASTAATTVGLKMTCIVVS